jgi:hypothetical protein
MQTGRKGLFIMTLSVAGAIRAKRKNMLLTSHFQDKQQCSEMGLSDQYLILTGSPAREFSASSADFCDLCVLSPTQEKTNDSR